MSRGPRTRRLIAFAATFALALTGLLIMPAGPAAAATRAFTPVYTTNTTGDVLIRGNNLETCKSGDFSAGSTTLSCTNVQNGTSNGVNNNFFMSYVDTDSDSTTFDSSSATVTIPAGATVLYAGLSWSGTSGAGSLANYPALTGVAAPNANIRNTVSFKVPGSSTYATVTSAATVDSTGSGYQGFRDVTSAVLAAGSGSYTVANVQAGTGGNDYAGWALAVAYRDPTQPVRNLTIFNGFTNVANGASTSIPISGFTTPLTGPVVTRMGAVVYEGDRGNVGDTMTLGSNAISNALNPVTDVENNSMTDLGVPITDRTPAYNNTLSVDIDRFDATGFLTNGQTSTTYNLKTVGDGYYPGLITLATNLYSPSLQATKTVKDLTSGITSSVKPGDVLAYSMAIKNVGGDGSTSSILTDAVPAGSTYVPGSLVIGGTPVTDASGDDAGNVAGGTVTARLGTGATAATGGALATGASTTVAFNVTVNAGAANGTVIANAAALGYSSATTGKTFIGTSNAVSSTVSVINVNPVLAFSAPPSGEVGANYTNTLTAAGGTGPYTWAVTTGTLPAGLVLGRTTGVISGPIPIGATSDFYNFTVSATDANGQVATETTSIYVAPQPTLTNPSSLQTANIGSAYSYPLGVNPGTGPYVWSVSAGSLPAGLTLDPSTGVISGTPPTGTVPATASFTAKVVDAFGAVATQALTLKVAAGPTLNNAAPPTGEVTVPYSDDLSVTGGSTPYIWTVSAGTLPAGITLDSASGLLSGTPTAAGTSNFTVTVTDVNGATASQAMAITVIAAPTVAFTPPQGEVGVAYTAQPTASGGTGSSTWSISAGALPAGLAIDPGTGAITGTPSAPSAASVTVQATDAVGGTATQARTITIVAAPTLTGTLPDGQLTVPYSSGFTVNDGIGPFVWSISTGTLPAGLSISTSTGLITGTPTTTDASTFTVQVTDAKNSTATRSGTITVTANPGVTFTPPNGEVGVAYTAQPTAAGGTSPYTWAVSAGTLPAGLSINATTGAITGTPTTATAATSVTVQVTDKSGRTATQAGTITIVATPTLTGTLAAGELTAPYSSGFTVSSGTGTGPFVWTVSSGTLPAGLSINNSTGLITGTPTATANSAITVQVTDANNKTATRMRTLSVTAGPAVTFTPPNGEVGAAYTAQPTASGGTSPYTWAVSTGTLPAGLSINTSTGAITGTPTTAGAASVSLQATDKVSGIATQAGTITIVATPTLTGTLAAAELTAPYSSGFTLTDGIGPFVWSIDISSGTLPPGLSINTSTGLITGTPTGLGSFPVTVQVTDANNFMTTRTGTMTVTAGPAVTFSPGSGEVGVAYTAQPTASGGTPAYTWSVSAGALPAGLSINPTTGAITGAPTAAGTSNVTVQATDAANGTAAQNRTILVVAAPTLTGTLTDGELTAPYSSGFTINDGTSPYVWALASGPLPAGLSLNTATGLITGTPTAAGSFPITVRITDAKGSTTTRGGTIGVTAGPAVAFTPAGGEVGVAYTAQPTASGGTGPYTWAVSAGTLPTGLSIDPGTGAITGTPSGPSVASVTVQATDANGGTGTQDRTITIVAAPTMTGTLSAGELTASYSSGFSVNDGTGPFVWSVSTGTLPAGLSLSTSTGLITGTPTAIGSFPITVRVTDAKGSTTTRDGTIAVTAGPTVAFTPPGGEVGVGYTAQPTASGGTGSTYTWAVSAGTLPAGLLINATTGAITGTPGATAAGSTTVIVQATDVNGGTGTQAGTITIVPAAPTLTGTLASGEVTAPYSSGFIVNNGTGPFEWTISAGTLPAGLAINTSTGLITGTPTGVGSSTITIQVTDASSRTTTRSGTVTVTAGPTVAFAPASGEVGVAYTAQPAASGGTGSYTWAVSVGTLPAGLLINATTGAITGTPTAAGATTVTVQATDANGGTGTQAGTVTIVAAPALTFTAPPEAELGVAYTDQLTKSGGVGTITWSVSAGTLPAGVTLAPSTGLLSGTPTAVGTSTFTVRIVDGNGQADTKDATIVVNKTTSTVTVTAPATTRFDTAITVTAAVGPSSATGTVTFTDVPTTGPQAGTTVTLGTGPVSGGAASLSTTLPAFGVNTVKATYNGDANRAAATSTTTQVEVSAYAGEVIVTEFRTSGPGGAADNYVELLNTGPTVPLGGIKITADSGAVSTLPANAGLLGTGRSYLVTGAGFTLAAIATSDYSVATVGIGGMKVTAPDTAATLTDAVGPATGFHTGTGLLPITGNPDSDWAWVRTELAGAAVNNHNNAADFQLVSTGLAPVGGVQPTLGSPSPTGTADPYQHNAALKSTLLDVGKGVAIAPNRVVVVPGTTGTLVIRRTITNTTGQTITAAKVRVSALSEQFGAKQPGVANQPATVAKLHAITPAAPTEQVTLTGGATVTVQDLSVDAPSAAPGGGLNSTFTVPLPGGGLAPGAKINVAFTFAVETRGTFWFGYDVDAK